MASLLFGTWRACSLQPRRNSTKDLYKKNIYVKKLLWYFSSVEVSMPLKGEWASRQKRRRRKKRERKSSGNKQKNKRGDSDNGGFFFACKDLGRMFDCSFPTCAFRLFVCLKWRLARTHEFHSFMPALVHSGSVSWDNCGQMFPDKLHVSLFPDKFPYYAWTAALSAHSDLVGSVVYACLGVTCHLHFWQNDQGLLRATVVTGLEWTPNKSQHTKLTLAPFPTPPPPTKKKEWVTYLSLDKVCCGRAVCFTCVIYGSSVQSFILTIVTHEPPFLRTTQVLCHCEKQVCWSLS